jgi:hypothetical protein
MYAELDKALHGKPPRMVTTGTFAGPESSPAGHFQKVLGANFDAMRKRAFANGHVDHPLPGGVIPSHEYTIFDVTTTTDESGKVRYWVKFRNPWGDTVPDKLDPNAPDAADPSEREKGFFWLEVGEYRQYFEDIAVQRFVGDPDLKGTPPAWTKSAS